MQVSQKKLPKSLVQLEVRLAPEEVEAHRAKALERLGKSICIEGFRPGHIPAKMLQRQLGEQRVFAEMAELAAQESYGSALKEQNIDAIGEPRIEVLKLAPGNPVELRITVAALPDVRLPDYKNIASQVEKKQVAVEEKEVDEALDWLKKSRKEELSDDFAKSIGNFENLDALKQSIKEGLRHEKEAQEKDRLRQEIVEKIAEKTHVAIPEVLVEREKQVLLQNIKHGVAQMSQAPFEEYLQQTGKTEQELLDSFQQEAEQRVKRFLVVRQVANMENIQPGQREIEDEASKILSHYKSAKKATKEVDPAQLHQYTEGVMRHEKTLQLLEHFTQP